MRLPKNEACKGIQALYEKTKRQRNGAFIMAVIFLLLALAIFIIPMAITDPFSSCNATVGFSYDSDFTVSAIDGDTEGEPILFSDSEDFAIYGAILTIIEIDPILIAAYERNITDGIPINETITDDVATYLTFKDILIMNANLQMFFMNYYAYMEEEYPIPTSEEILAAMIPLEPDTITSVRVNIPCIYAGITLIIGNQTEIEELNPEDVEDPMDIFYNCMFASIGFIESDVALDMNFTDIFESDFYMNDCTSLSFKLDSITVEIYEDDLPMTWVTEFAGYLNGDLVFGEPHEILADMMYMYGVMFRIYYLMFWI